MPDPVYVVGATGRSGAALCASLAADGVPFVPVVRSAERWAARGLPGAAAVADLTDPESLSRALAGARRVASCAHARYAGAVLDAAPDAARFVFLGSTRKFTRWPDAHGRGVLAGEAAFLASGRPGVMLHPTMIYGALGEDNVRRLATLVRRLPLVPLPGGGRALVQPIHQSDVTRCLRAALDIPWDRPETLVIAGPSPISYAGFVRSVASAAGHRRPRVVPLPPRLLRLAAAFTVLPGLPRVRGAEVRRLMENKAFDTAEMRRRLGVVPVSLVRGLAETFTPTP